MKKVLVTGATGAQGGSVARHLIERGQFAVRCLTRNPNSEKARALADAGAEIVKGDLSDLPAVAEAVKGCYGVFGVTNYWEHFDAEYQMGKNLIDAVAAENTQHFILSTLPDPKSLSDEPFNIPHFEIKARLEKYTRELDIRATFIHVAFYYENFISFFPPQKQEDGTYAFGFPQGDTPLAAVTPEDLGGVVATVFEHPEEHIGRTVGVVGDDLPPHKYADIMARILNTKIVYRHIPRETYENFPFPGADDLANMFDLNRKYILSRADDMAESRRLYPRMQTFESWLTANKSKFSEVIG